MTQLQASASVGREPLDGCAPTANQASGASPAAAPVSATATQTSVTPAPGSVETAGTTRLDTSVNGKGYNISDQMSDSVPLPLVVKYLSAFALVVWMASLGTQCLAQGNTVGPAPALETPAQITLTDTPVKLTTALTRSSATASKATVVNYDTVVSFVADF